MREIRGIRERLMLKWERVFQRSTAPAVNPTIYDERVVQTAAEQSIPEK